MPDIKTVSDGNLILPRRVRAAMITRSFLIQASNNFERMLSLGFAYALGPALGFIYRDKRERIAAYRRHLEFFNTQPYFANSVLGVVAHAETFTPADRVATETTAIKRAMMGAFGALGDDIFWAGVMPAATTLALLTYAVWPAAAGAGAAAAVLIYNMFHFWVRVSLFNISLRLGRQVTRYYRLLRLPRMAMRVKMAAAFLLGATAVAAGLGPITTHKGSSLGPAVFFASALTSYLLIRAGSKAEWNWLVLTSAAAVVGVFIF